MASTALDQTSSFTSRVPWEGDRIGAAALYCSDGRFGEQMDDLCHNHLSWPRYDRLAVPGGPACLSGALAVFWEQHGVEKQLEFLLRVHEIENLVLVAHEGCAFYRLWLRVPADGVEAAQRADIARAGTLVRRMAPRLAIHGFMARRRDSAISFERV